MIGTVKCTCIHLGNRVSQSQHDPNRVTCHSAAGSGSQTNAQGLLTMTLTEGPVLGGGAFSRVSIVTEEVRVMPCWAVCVPKDGTARLPATWAWGQKWKAVRCAVQHPPLQQPPLPWRRRASAPTR